jgi:hypothetical protein
MRIDAPLLRHVLEPLALEHFEILPDPCIFPREMILPCVATVYCLLDSENNIKYVGQTKNLRLRIAQHANSPKKARLGYERIAWWSPQIVSPHSRLVLEAILTVLAIPVGNSCVALRRTRYGTFTEITSLRWRTWGNKDKGEE